MHYYSLNKKSESVSFREAAVRGQAPDRGLYFPSEIPKISEDWIRNMRSFTNEEIAYHVIRPYVGEDIDETSLHQIVSETVNFDIPLVSVTDKISSLELFHGPTLAFKDIGARFMSRCLGYFVKHRPEQINGKVVVLVATSGDTGGAVANGFYKVDGVEVVILYPSGKVSNVQEKQLTTLSHNIHAIEVNGSFDDCQHLVKQAFLDETLKQQIFLTSANSINVARWLPQQFYYFFAWKQWQDTDRPPVICVPSGNFGNICAGMLAHESGLPVNHFIAACNANAVIPGFMQTGGVYQPMKAVPTISNAMDVGDPSNFVRIMELMQQEFPRLQSCFSSVSISDDDTKATLLRVFKEYDYLMDPHGAVGFLALENYLNAHPAEKGIFLETAHPVKFFDVVEPLIEQQVPLPESVAEIINHPKKAVQMDVSSEALRDYLMKF